MNMHKEPVTNFSSKIQLKGRKLGLGNLEGLFNFEVQAFVAVPKAKNFHGTSLQAVYLLPFRLYQDFSCRNYSR